MGGFVQFCIQRSCIKLRFMKNKLIANTFISAFKIAEAKITKYEYWAFTKSLEMIRCIHVKKSGIVMFQDDFERSIVSFRIKYLKSTVILIFLWCSVMFLRYISYWIYTYLSPRSVWAWMANLLATNWLPSLSIKLCYFQHFLRFCIHMLVPIDYWV